MNYSSLLCQSVCGDRMACRDLATESGAEVGDKERESGGKSAMPHHTAPPGPSVVTHEEGEQIKWCMYSSPKYECHKFNIYMLRKLIGSKHFQVLMPQI